MYQFSPDKFGLVKCARLTQVVVDLLRPRAILLPELDVSGDLDMSWLLPPGNIIDCIYNCVSPQLHSQGRKFCKYCYLLFIQRTEGVDFIMLIEIGKEK